MHECEMVKFTGIVPVWEPCNALFQAFEQHIYSAQFQSYLCICLSFPKDCKLPEIQELCGILTFVYSAGLTLGLLIIEKVLSNTCQMKEGNKGRNEI